MILLAPFTHLSSPDQPTELLQSAHTMYPDQFDTLRLPELSYELETLVSSLDLTNTTKSWFSESDFTFIMASEDTALTPLHHSQFLKQFDQSKLKIHVLNDDHSFTKDPRKLTEVISALLKN